MKNQIDLMKKNAPKYKKRNDSMSEKQQAEKTQTEKVCLIISSIALILSIVSLLNIAVIMGRMEKEEPLPIEWHDGEAVAIRRVGYE